jgi:type IV secretory pathway VirJ component
VSTDLFIRDLTELLMRVDRGMLEFEEPPPENVATGLMQVLRAFGEQAVPVIHAVLREHWSQGDGGSEAHLVDVIAEIGDASSVPFLIELHARHANYLTSFAAIQALRELRTEAAYTYLAQLLMRYGDGDHRVFQTMSEATTCCLAMDEWNDPRAVAPLQTALRIEAHSVHGIQEVAEAALARYRENDMLE